MPAIETNRLFSSRGGSRRHLLPLALILAVAFGWRLNNIAFGLPSMWDPDEPIFMSKALILLDKATLNPGWFGHPGTTIIYLVAAIDAAVVALGMATGRWDNLAQFAAAAYADPAILFVPARVAMALIAVLAVWLTWLVGRRLLGTAGGLAAAALLALNPLHIQWSQVVRTDILSSLFMLACLLFALRAAERGALRDYLIAGAFVGFAAATKWPAAISAIAIVGAAAWRWRRTGEFLAEIGKGATAALAGIAGLFLASPYILLDWRTVVANVAYENKASHVGHNGGGLIENMGWYLGEQVAGSMGVAGLMLAAAGVAVIAARSPLGRWQLLPLALANLLLISGQGLIWSRWALPLLPFACIFAAAGLVWMVGRISEELGGVRRTLTLTVLLAIAFTPSLLGAFGQARERSNDTRGRAADWAIANIPPGSRVAVEHFEIALRDQPWRILFPLGELGCIDGKQALAQRIDFDEVDSVRGGLSVVDLGNVAPDKAGRCRADYAILTYYDLYLAEAARYRRELGTYDRLLAGGRTVALFRPERGLSGGPVVRIVAVAEK